MTENASLDLYGNFAAHRPAEVCSEIFQAGLTGSLRASAGANKSVVYFEEGSAVFAVSNARFSRLFDILLKRGDITARSIGSVKNFANDNELAAALLESKTVTSEALKSAVTAQVETVIRELFTWKSGEWAFSPLTRVREDMRVNVDIVSLLLEHARTLTPDDAASRLGESGESIVRAGKQPEESKLTGTEQFMLYRTETMPRTIGELLPANGTDPNASKQLVYTLWLGGYVARRGRVPAFLEDKIAAIQTARLGKIKAARDAPAAPAAKPVKPEAPPAAVVTLEEYLNRVETASTHYDTLGVERKCGNDVIRNAYFSLVKTFHPDRFHKGDKDILKRIQHAFTEVAAAYETLKTGDGRLAYDKKLDAEDAKREKRVAEGGSAETGVRELQKERAEEDFAYGADLLAAGDHASAVPFLARAVHYDPENARYHAFYGRALSVDESQRHKAESEFQTAIKLDGSTPEFRLMLAEFFLQVNLVKRAEGEINRLLDIFPNNMEAVALLDRLAKK